MAFSVLTLSLLSSVGSRPTTATWDTLCPRFTAQPPLTEVARGFPPPIVEYYLSKHPVVGHRGILYTKHSVKDGEEPFCIGPLTERLFRLLTLIGKVKKEGAPLPHLLSELDSIYRKNASKLLLYLLSTKGSMVGGYANAYSYEGSPWPVWGEEEGATVVRDLLRLMGGKPLGDSTVVWGGDTFNLRRASDMARLYEVLSRREVLFPEDVELFSHLTQSYGSVRQLISALSHIEAAEEVLRACAERPSCYPLRDGALDRAEAYAKKALEILGGSNER